MSGTFLRNHFPAFLCSSDKMLPSPHSFVLALISFFFCEEKRCIKGANGCPHHRILWQQRLLVFMANAFEMPQPASSLCLCVVVILEMLDILTDCSFPEIKGKKVSALFSFLCMPVSLVSRAEMKINLWQNNFFVFVLSFGQKNEQGTFSFQPSSHFHAHADFLSSFRFFIKREWRFRGIFFHPLCKKRRSFSA